MLYEIDPTIVLVSFIAVCTCMVALMFVGLSLIIKLDDLKRTINRRLK